MKYDTLQDGIFYKRVNRFLALCYVQGALVYCHVPNTSRLTELCVEGRRVALLTHDNPNRKTKYTIIHIEKQGRWVNIDSQAPNNIVTEAINRSPHIIGLNQSILKLKREVKYKNSRFDLSLESENMKGFLEIKGVTLEENKIAMFPGAPTTRGTKHLLELMDAKEKGYWAGVFFCIQLDGVREFRPHIHMDPKFSKTLIQAQKAGVNIFAYQCSIHREEVCLQSPVSINLDVETE